jgi:two-component system NarL family sensor kinase
MRRDPEWGRHSEYPAARASDYHVGPWVNRASSDLPEGDFTDSGNYLSAQDEERVRLGRALHDSTGQLLLSLSLSFAHFKAKAHDSRLEAMLNEMGETVTKIASEIRTFSFLEYPAELRSEGLPDALAMFARGFAKRTGLRVDFESRLIDEIADSRTALALLRIGQEALVNVHRHAAASVVHLTLLKRAGEIELAVIDDGRGYASAEGSDPHHGIGLAGMRNRAERLGGRLSIKTLQHGTEVVATIPLKSSLTAVVA